MKQEVLFNKKIFSETQLATIGLTPTGRKMTEYGGSIRKNKRKVARPFDSKKSIHFVMQSSFAKGPLSLSIPKNKKMIQNLINALSKKYSIQIHSYANVGNHLHLLVQTKSKQSLRARAQIANFIRELSGRIAFKIMNAKKGKTGKFWDQLTYSKIVEWGRQFKTITGYLLFNDLEGQNKLIRFGKNPSQGWELICDSS